MVWMVTELELEAMSQQAGGWRPAEADRTEHCSMEFGGLHAWTTSEATGSRDMFPGTPSEEAWNGSFLLLFSAVSSPGGCVVFWRTEVFQQDSRGVIFLVLGWIFFCLFFLLGAGLEMLVRFKFGQCTSDCEWGVLAVIAPFAGGRSVILWLLFRTVGLS